MGGLERIAVAQATFTFEDGAVLDPSGPADGHDTANNDLAAEGDIAFDREAFARHQRRHDPLARPRAAKLIRKPLRPATRGPQSSAHTPPWPAATRAPSRGGRPSCHR